jgi:hypothetical protein
MMWFVLSVTLISHIGLLVLFEKQRKQLDSLRKSLNRHRSTIRDMESQLRIASGRLFK